MYLKLPDRYPYSLSDFRAENPQVSISDTPSEESLNLFGVVSVKPVSKPIVDHTMNAIAQTPRLVNGEWVEAWALEMASAEQIAERTAQQAAHVRELRNSELQACDWWVIRAAETGATLTPEQLAYRQALRNITLQPKFPFNIDWPVKP